MSRDWTYITNDISHTLRKIWIWSNEVYINIFNYVSVVRISKRVILGYFNNHNKKYSMTIKYLQIQSMKKYMFKNIPIDWVG